MLLKAFSIFLIAVIVVLVVAIFHDKGFIVFDGGMELASIMLAASSLVVTGVGVLAGILAIFGYGQIKDAALHEARTEARRVATEVASSVAGRVAREVRPSDTTDQEAVDIVANLDNEAAKWFKGNVADPFEVIARHQKAPPIPLDAISAELGLRVVPMPLGQEIAGQIIRDGRSRSGYSIYINSTQHPNRQRFTWAHEIAHFALHRDLIESGIVDDTMYRSTLSNFYEVQANKMAADILMPIRLVKRWRDLMQLDVNQLAREFQVSPASMQIRLDGLKA